MFFDQTNSTTRLITWILDSLPPECDIDTWKNTLFLPFVASVLSAATLSIQFLNWAYTRRRLREHEQSTRAAWRDEPTRKRTSQRGIALFRIARVVCAVALLVLSIISFRQHSYAPYLGLVITFSHTVVLAALALLKSAPTFTHHANAILLIAFGVYAYRDLWPLRLTSSPEPGDFRIEGAAILWTKLALLGVAAMLIPIFIPREPYTHAAVGSAETDSDVSPQQSASLFSLVFYTFMDPLIRQAQKVVHLSHDRLPGLVQEDKAARLRAEAFPYLDPFTIDVKRKFKKEHLFFSFMRVFFWDFLVMALALTGSIVAGFIAPLALNRILAAIENTGSASLTSSPSVHPLIWAACLFLGPISVSLCTEYYYFTSTGVLARAQAVLTQLVFEHSLRLRFAASTDREETGADAERGPGTENANVVGKINTIITVDVDNIIGGKEFLLIALQGPLELGLALVFLYAVLGWSAFVGFISIVLLLPVPGYLANLMQTIQNEKMTKTDARVQALTETVGVLRMIKLFGWEKKISSELKAKREEELTWLWKGKVVALMNDLITHILPIVTMLVTYASYTLIQKESLTASKLFSSMAVFNIIRNLLNQSGWVLDLCVSAKVSLDRISTFLADTELLDAYAHAAGSASATDNTEQLEDPTAHGHGDVIGFNNATFTWSKESHPTRSFTLRVEKLQFKRGAVNLIVGPTGSGKTAILMALLGEMHFVPTGHNSWFSLPRSGGVAYAPQESWVENETIRENILFGSPYDESRYQKVLHQCALKPDLLLFEAGDNTEVGEKGLTLSGGQKARLTLARAIYSSAKIILLDDILAALDVHTAKWIVKECLTGDLIRGRTVLLVTHNIALAAPIASYVVTVGPDGLVSEVGTGIDDILAVPALAKEVEAEQDEAAIEEEVIDQVEKEGDTPDGKLILAEEIKEGRVTWKAVNLYLKGLGGRAPGLFLTFYLSGLLLEQVCNMLSVWFLGKWGSQYETHAPGEVHVLYYLAVYSIIQLASNGIYVTANMTYIFGTRRASRHISSELIDSVLVSTLRWLDETPASRIIARFTQDIGAVDTAVTDTFSQVCDMAVLMVSKLAGPVIFTPIFIIPGVSIAILGIYIGNIYLKAQMSVKREMSNARSPVLAHFGAAVAGMVSIRAYGAQQRVKEKSLTRIDHYTKISRTSYNLNRWISIRMDLLGAIFTSALAVYLIKTRSLSSANTGFSLVMALEFTHMILWVVKCYNSFEVNSNSLERIQAYLEIEHEPKSTLTGKPPASWPKSGNLRVEGLSARYSPAGPLVLHDLTFDIKSGERVGIVGRTGSGKSTLTLSLLRLIPTTGTVYYDDLPTSKINLEDLRSSITIIPQVPELLTGSLRRNLDPFAQYNDSVLNDSLRAAGLFSLQGEEGNTRITLDSEISGGGGNLSIGQRQIIALARAMVRDSKLLILDEATSAIDHKTDNIIQNSLRHGLASDVTVLTVAHRLQTIMDADRILVLENGHVVENDSPQKLLEMKGGHFKALVDESGDKNSLYKMAAQKTPSTE